MARCKTLNDEPPPGFGENDPISLGLKRLAAFEKGGCVERLLKNLHLTPGGNVSAVGTNHEEVKSAMFELEQLLPEKPKEGK
jgi:hypothetical protein